MARQDHTGCNFIDEPVRLGAGSAVERHQVIGAASWKKGATAPTEGFNALYPYLGFQDGRSDEAYYVIHVPYRRKAGTSIVVEIRWFYSGLLNAGKVLWKCNYRSSGCNDTPNGLGTEISVLSTADNPRFITICSTMTTDIIDANLTADDDLALHIWRDGGDLTDTLTDTAKLLSVHVYFTMNKFGNDI